MGSTRFQTSTASKKLNMKESEVWFIQQMHQLYKTATLQEVFNEIQPIHSKAHHTDTRTLDFTKNVCIFFL